MVSFAKCFEAMTLAIIGTAGRKEDAAKLTLDVWDDMKRCVYAFITERGVKDVISGGAGGADHLAVGLFNAGLVDTLTLALPCAFDWHAGQFVDTGVRDWRENPGQTCNFYHRQFSRVISQPSLEQLKTAIYNGTTVELEAGFMARNSIVARADALIAFTFGNGPVPKDGGTKDTIRKHLALGRPSFTHVDLHTMTLYENGEV